MKNNDIIYSMISSFVKMVKEDKISPQQMEVIYLQFKRHELSPQEKEWAKTIIPRIKEDKLTIDMLYSKALNWKQGK